MDWGQIGHVPDFPTWRAKLNYYRTHHPIIVGLAIVGAISVSYSVYKINTLEEYHHIPKYKDRYLVYRPDDPHLKMIRRGPIGLDRYRYK